MTFVRIVSSAERNITNALARFLVAVTAGLARVLGRGRHREWRKRGEADARRRSGGAS